MSANESTAQGTKVPAARRPLLDPIFRVCGWVLLVLFLVMVAVAFLQVVTRYVFQYPLPWSEELVRYLFIWTGFLGGAVASYEGSHIEIDVLDSLLQRLPAFRRRRAERGFGLVANLLTLAFVGVFIYLAVGFLGDVAALGQRSTAMGPNMLIPMSSILVGAVLMAVALVGHVVRMAGDSSGPKEREET